MRLQFLGCGDAFGSGGQFNTCFHVTTGSTQFLVDCGASSMIAIRRFGVEPNAIEIIFITHLHGDHFGGLPFFVLDAQLVSRRTTPLTMAGPPGLRERLPRGNGGAVSRLRGHRPALSGRRDRARRWSSEHGQWCHRHAVSDEACLRRSTVRAPPGM